MNTTLSLDVTSLIRVPIGPLTHHTISHAKPTLIGWKLLSQVILRCYIPIPEQFKCFNLINCGNKSKSFLSFISYIVVSQHKVQVSCTSSHII